VLCVVVILGCVDTNCHTILAVEDLFDIAFQDPKLGGPEAIKALKSKLLEKIVIEVNGRIAVQQRIDPGVFAPVDKLAAKLESGVQSVNILLVSEEEVVGPLEQSDKASVGTLTNPQNRFVGIVNRDDLPVVVQPGAKVGQTQDPGGSDSDDGNTFLHLGSLVANSAA